MPCVEETPGLRIADPGDLEASGTPRIRVGNAGRKGGPDLTILVERDDVPLCRVEVFFWPDDYHFRPSAELWGSWLILGFGARVILVSLDDHRQVRVDLSDEDPASGFDYFGSFCKTDDALLIASGQRVFCVRRDGIVAWVSERLGLDGVIIHAVGPSEIAGSGEWDPPGGWLDFRISRETGASLRPDEAAVR